MKRFAMASIGTLVVGLLALSASHGTAAGPPPAQLAASVFPVAAIQVGVVKSITVQALVEILQDSGYRAKIEHTSTGRPMIKSSTGGVNFRVILYDPSEEESHYEDFQIVAWFNESFEGTIDDANAWNLKKRHGSAVYDSSDNTIGISMDLTLKGGVTEDYLTEYFELWDGMLASFSQYIADAH